uniref:Uncharacterized protein n=1 Tax=Brassica campestris TaxID=3711 RepID=A0A3P5YVV7_BRACM|nr:unnamed protein product [Brassica rapa]
MLRYTFLVYLGTGKSSTSDQHGGILSEEHFFNIFLV